MLNIPSIQQTMSVFVAKELSEVLNTKVVIGRINIGLLNRIIIDDVSKAFGVFLDEELNAIRGPENRVISHQYSQIKVMVIPTNEEVMIARDTVRLLGL